MFLVNECICKARLKTTSEIRKNKNRLRAKKVDYQKRQLQKQQKVFVVLDA